MQEQMPEPLNFRLRGRVRARREAEGTPRGRNGVLLVRLEPRGNAPACGAVRKPGANTPAARTEGLLALTRSANLPP